jgi:hypothetical protein
VAGVTGAGVPVTLRDALEHQSKGFGPALRTLAGIDLAALDQVLVGRQQGEEGGVEPLILELLGLELHLRLLLLERLAGEAEVFLLMEDLHLLAQEGDVHEREAGQAPQHAGGAGQETAQVIEVFGGLPEDGKPGQPDDQAADDEGDGQVADPADGALHAGQLALVAIRIPEREASCSQPILREGSRGVTPR